MGARRWKNRDDDTSPCPSRAGWLPVTASTGAGSTPKPTSPRRLAAWLCIRFGLLPLVGGVIVSFLVGTPFSWAGFLIVGGIIFFLFAAFVWIRLAD